MAQFTAQGRLKLLFNNGGTHCKLLGNDFLGGLRSSPTQKRKIRFLGANCTKLCAAASLSKKSKHFYTEASQSVSEASDESDEDYDSERDELACFRGLVLDISYRPVNVVCWKRAMCLEFMEKADVLEYYDQTVNSPSGSFYIPAVLRVPHLLQVVKRRRIFRSKLSRKNILHRDNYTCQYCSSHENLTIDHVLPTAQGGEWQWENLRWPYNVWRTWKINRRLNTLMKIYILALRKFFTVSWLASSCKLLVPNATQRRVKKLQRKQT